MDNGSRLIRMDRVPPCGSELLDAPRTAWIAHGDWIRPLHGRARLAEPDDSLSGLLLPEDWLLVRPQTVVYRFFDDRWRLLYVGVTYDPLERFRTHSWKAPWWEHISFLATAAYETREAALLQEKWAIFNEEPKFNRARPHLEPF